MKINSLKYKDGFEGWELSQLDFFDLTLLVGVSGVGKTQILTAIRNIKKIARGQPLNGVEWEISFENNGNDYNWSGEFEKWENRKDSSYSSGEQT